MNQLYQLTEYESSYMNGDDDAIKTHCFPLNNSTMNRNQFLNSTNKFTEILRGYKMKILDRSNEEEKIELLEQLKLGYMKSPSFIKEIVSEELSIDFDK